MRGPAVRLRLAILVLALGSLLGAPCDKGESKTWVGLQPDASSVATFSPLVVDILVSSPTPIQAVDLGLRWDPEMLNALTVLPHPDFDDDGVLFTEPTWNHLVGRLDRVVDLRHGGEGAEGGFAVATLWFMTRGVPGSTSIEPTVRGMADGDGDQPTIETAPLTITIEP
jgi:hypothetical protein